MKLKSPPSPDYPFTYKQLPRSGNAINGLGEREPRRASKVFHATGGEKLDWIDLDTYFSLKSPWGIVWRIMRNRWTVRNSVGPVARRRIDIDDKEAWAGRIKDKAVDFGAGKARITHITENELYEGCSTPYRTAICIAIPMDREKMADVPWRRAQVEVMRAYGRNARTAVRLAKYIRSLGWNARAYGNPNSVDILQIPLAVRAGIGELGKHGSVICREYGSNFRLSTVLTDMPLAEDEAVDIAVQDLCSVCRRCTTDCPPDAIFEEQQWVRGEKKWYVDFDRCVPYFVKMDGCAICIEVCPWSEAGRGPQLSDMLLAKRRKKHLEKAAE